MQTCSTTWWSINTHKLGKKYGVGVNGFLSFAFYNIYRDVSEVIHGSYYGMRIFIGMQNKDITAFKSAEEATQYFTDPPSQVNNPNSSTS